MKGTLREPSAPLSKVLMFPWLAHGHISPFVELSKRLAKSHFQVYLCSNHINLDFIKQSTNDYSIHLVQLDLPDLPELPPHCQTTKSLPIHLQSTLRRALNMAQSNFQNILNTLKPDLLIHDAYQPWASELASRIQIPSVLFLVAGAVNLSLLYHSIRHADQAYPFPEIFFREHEIKKLLAAVQESNENDQDNGVDVLKSFDVSSDIILVKSWREIEGKHIDYLSSSCGKKVVSVGPLINQEHDFKEEGIKDSQIIEFLNSKPEGSVVYVSFGSEYFLSNEEREEMAHGLELSNANFIWVVRFPAGHAIGLEEALPEGFLERVKGRGIVVDGWAPQAKILEHPSTGGFVCHCGWGSVIESIYYGVLLLPLPMHLDQPIHARLAVETGVGIEILKDEDGKIRREEVAEVIKKVVVEKKEGEVQREKVRKLSKTLKEEGEKELDEALEKLKSLCPKNK